MKKIIPLFLLILIISFGCKTKNAEEKPSEEKIENKLTFPKDFFGVYKGKLKINNMKGSQEIDMEYHLLKTDSVGKYAYKLVYNGQPRDYFLIEKDKKKGIYEVDENNGIILPTFLNDNTLHSFFEVQGNFLSSRAKFYDNKVDFEILFTALKNKEKSGGGDFPEVFGHPISTFQKATLVKQQP